MPPAVAQKLPDPETVPPLVDADDILDALRDTPLGKAIDALDHHQRSLVRAAIDAEIPDQILIKDLDEDGECTREKCVDAREENARITRQMERARSELY